ncbi:unnamed protein product, partial [Musa textilis]
GEHEPLGHLRRQPPSRWPYTMSSFSVNEAPIHDGKAYTNLFDATEDALVAALQKLGFPNILVTVMGMGWLTTGNTTATPEKATTYFNWKTIM